MHLPDTEETIGSNPIVPTNFIIMVEFKIGLFITLIILIVFFFSGGDEHPDGDGALV
jgi:hypothetical protein